MTFSLINSWQIEGEKVEAVANILFLAPKSLQMVTAAVKVKDAYPWKESYDKPSQLFKSRDIVLLTKVCIVKAMVFSVAMYRCESWTIKKGEHQRADTFELGCWRRLSSVPWPARRSNQSILKEISPEYSLDGLMLKLKLQYFGQNVEELTHWKRLQC